MKKQLFFFLGAVVLLTLLPSRLFAQSTEGTDFWVTLMRGDERNYDDLLLTFSANHATKVYIENNATGYKDTVEVGDNDIQQLNLNANEESCYVTDLQQETPVYRALHVTSDKPISLIAANYKNKSFDVASILPTSALLSEYRIQCYSPTAHEDNAQGSHFAIVAADDNVVVDIVLTANTNKGEHAGETLTTDTLKRGQVYYVWTGYGSGLDKDFTGTEVKARNGKKIAVFNGNSHTNIPNAIRDRDHVYSQAMPINYWGRRFAITSSLTTIDGQSAGTYWERIDKIRVQALVDSTVVKLDGDTIHVFSFEKGNDEDKKHFFEFDFGKKDGMTNYDGDGKHTWYDGVSHYIETSCPCAVHLFMTSDRYDHKSGKYCNGDPSEIWVNPIEQKIKELTFGTFETKQVKDHFINIVTTKDNVASVRYDGTDISAQFEELKGDTNYVFARLTGVVNGTHTLISDSGFIAHVYGFGEKESYGYPAGGNTKDLSAYITINGKEFRPGEENLLCGDDTINFSCELNYDFDSIYWFFGDGQDSLIYVKDTIRHYYEQAGTYEAYVRIFRPIGEADECIDWNDNIYDSIPFHVNIGRNTFEVTDVDIPCEEVGKPWVGKIYYSTGGAKVNLSGENVTIKFDEAAKEGGFKDDELVVKDGYFQITIHKEKAKSDAVYGIDLKITSECGGTDTTLNFALNFDNNIIQQRYTYLLGLDSTMQKYLLSDFQWYRTSDSTAVEGQVSPNLNFYELPASSFSGDSYYVCFTINKGKADEVHKCACAKPFNTSGETPHFNGPEDLIITATYTISGQSVFVNADWGGKTDIDCFAQWIKVDGTTSPRYDVPDGGCTIPAPSDNGLYLLRVTTDGGSRTFKFMINH